MLSATARPPVSLSLNPSHIPDAYADARFLGYSGPSRSVRVSRVASSGGGAISKSDDGRRCVIAGKECAREISFPLLAILSNFFLPALRILRMLEPSSESGKDHRFVIGRGGHRIEASRNFWDGSGLKVDSTPTDVVWCPGCTSDSLRISVE
jgi:WD repeat-containing protein 24